MSQAFASFEREDDESEQEPIWSEIIAKGAANWTLEDMETVMATFPDNSYNGVIARECISRLRNYS